MSEGFSHADALGCRRAVPLNARRQHLHHGVDAEHVVLPRTK